MSLYYKFVDDIEVLGLSYAHHTYTTYTTYTNRSNAIHSKAIIA